MRSESERSTVIAQYRAWLAGVPRTKSVSCPQKCRIVSPEIRSLPARQAAPVMAGTALRQSV
jgi:hypothetical protein